MPSAQELMDLAGEIEVNKGLRDVHSKNLEARQPSLFGPSMDRETEKANMEGMKKAAVEKLDKQEAIKEAKAKAELKQETAADEFKKKNQQRPMISPGGNVFKGATSGGGGASGGAGGIELEGKMGRNTKPKMKAGGKVKSASSRADGCCIRGKTRA